MTVVVEVAYVARGHVAVDHVLVVLVARVALEQHGVADEDLSGLARRLVLAALLVEDPDRGPGRGGASGTGGVPEVLGGGDRHPGHLSRAVEVVEVVLEG